MRLPKVMMVFGSKIKVIRKLMEENGGLYSPDPDNKIEICTSVSSSELTRILTHEFNHCIMDKSSLNDAVKDGVDEVIVNQFAKAYRESFVLIPKGVGDTTVKHYAIYSAYGDLKCFHTIDSIKNAAMDHGDHVVELFGVTKFKRKRKLSVLGKQSNN